jgi:uncharacterized protein (AIM24 family)
MPIHGSLFQQYAETTGSDPFTLQNKKMLKCFMQYGQVFAKLGSMVAYQGDVRFTKAGSGGLNKMLKSKMTGEGVDLMVCDGSGELFLADNASEIQVFYLDDDMVSVNGASILAFSASIDWDIHRVSAGSAGMMAGGMYNISLQGTGYVAVLTKGEPVVLDIAGAPTFADADAVVLWTSGVAMDVRVDTGGMRSMLRGGTGELLQMAFRGQGHVMVQPAENAAPGAAQQSGSGGMLGGLLGG